MDLDYGFIMDGNGYQEAYFTNEEETTVLVTSPPLDFIVHSLPFLEPSKPSIEVSDTGQQARPAH